MQESQVVQSLDREDPLEKEVATHSSMLVVKAVSAIDKWDYLLSLLA